MDLDECFKKGLIKKTKIDPELSKSLIEMSDIKEDTVNKADIDDVNISVYVSVAYDSLREILEALCIMQGYKVISHICIGKLLKESITQEDYQEFDRLRWIRNSINYYGEKVEFQQGREIITKIFSIKKRLLNNNLKELK